MRTGVPDTAYAVSVLHLAGITADVIETNETETPHMAFTAPKGQGDILKPADVIGHLLIVKPLEFVPDMTTKFGTSDAIRCDVADLNANGPDGTWGVVSSDALWFGRALVGGLRKQLGELVLGWMAHGIGKPGQDPPYVLSDALGNADAVRVAQQWLDAHPDFAQTTAAPSVVPAPVPASPVPAATIPVPAAVPTTPTPPVAPAPLPLPGASAVPAAPAGNPALGNLNDEQRAALAALGYKVG